MIKTLYLLKSVNQILNFVHISEEYSAKNKPAVFQAGLCFYFRKSRMACMLFSSTLGFLAPLVETMP
jgi:hypothetical protein